MIIHNCIQRSDEWFALHIGRITGTSFTTMANGKADSIETLCLKTAAGRITGQPSEAAYTNPAMEHGVECEDSARTAYMAAGEFVMIEEVGFIGHSDFPDLIGVSPDGLVNEDGGLELKCPMPHTHLAYRTNGGNAWKAYRWQIQGALWVTGRAWWDFVSFNPYFPEPQRLYVERVLPDSEAFAKLQAGAEYCAKRIAEIEASNG